MIIVFNQQQRNLQSSEQPNGPVIQTVSTTFAPLAEGEVFDAITVGAALLTQNGILPPPPGYVAGVPQIVVDPSNAFAPGAVTTILETPV
jgi:hypothetical protein